MAYSKNNRLQRIVDIQETTLRLTQIGVTQERVFTDHIEKQYRISRRCYYYYLSVNAKNELKKMEATKQLALF
jgi:hypothetical protein